MKIHNPICFLISDRNVIYIFFNNNLKMLLINCIIFSFISVLTADELNIKNIIFVIISQEDSFHHSLALNLKESLENQSQNLGSSPPIYLTHQDLPHPGAWTILPLLTQLNALHSHNATWYVFLDNLTKILSLPLLIHELNLRSSSEPIWLGHALFDQEPTIIHHFNTDHFAYPNLASGLVLSSFLVKQLAQQLEIYNELKDTFSVDPSHELALFIWNNGQGPKLEHSHIFCTKKEKYCFSYPEFPTCGHPIDIESVYFAVKTCKKFHQARVANVVQRTWGQETKNIGYFSESDDPSIPTIPLQIEITDRGHCKKTFAIIDYFNSFNRKTNKLKWLVIADDDTLLSVTRILELLSCFKENDNLILGERYGYQVRYGGYNYITGGGGIILGKEAALIVAKNCQCPSSATPDDMFLGSCLARLRLPITHSPLFHQARPNDYAVGYLQALKPVSFHKHWLINPVDVFRKWFQRFTPTNTHSEL